MSGDAGSWDALEQAIFIAQHEGAKLHGLHIVDSTEKVEDATSLTIREQFGQRCADAGVEGNLVTEAGEITSKISERANMTDLVVLKIAHPPQGGLSALKSPFRSIIAQSSRPLLCVPETASRFQRALLAYDGSPRSKEALFMAAYLAETWQTELMVVSAIKGAADKDNIHDYVRRYLDIHEVQAQYLVTELESMGFLTTTANDLQADLILMGGDQGSALRNVISGSLLDHTLRESTVPIFICH